MRPEPAAQYQPNPIAVRPPIGPAGSSSQLPLGAGLYAAHYQEPNLPAMNSAEPPAPQLETYYAPPPPLLSNHPFQSQAGLLPTPQLKTYYAPPPLFYSNPIQSQAGLLPTPQLETYYALPPSLDTNPTQYQAKDPEDSSAMHPQASESTENY